MRKIDEFYDLRDFSIDEIDCLLELAARLEKEPSPRALEGRVLAMLFLSPSLRTLTSFQASMARLGGGTFVISPEMSIHGLETRQGITMDGRAAEHVREAVPVIASYADVMGIRAFAKVEDLPTDLADREFSGLRSLCNVPLVNMESAIHHPCQSLADWKTMEDLGIPRNGGKLVFSWVYHPDALPLAVMGDTIQMALMRGMHVSVLRPEGFELPEDIVSRTQQTAAKYDASFEETSDRHQAMNGAHIVYANSWSSTEHYGNRLADQKLRNEHEDWCVDNSWFDKAHDTAKFMHCLPVRRGVEVEDEILDSERSVVIRQAKNRMYTQMAILRRMFD